MIEVRFLAWNTTRRRSNKKIWYNKAEVEGGISLWNVGAYLPEYTASDIRRQQFPTHVCPVFKI